MSDINDPDGCPYCGETQCVCAEYKAADEAYKAAMITQNAGAGPASGDEAAVSRSPERILCAAIYIDDGEAHLHQPKNIGRGVVVCGRRHHNAIVIAGLLFPMRNIDHDQGFVTSRDRYVGRAEAARIAFAAGQIDEPTDILFSEDLY